VTVIEYRTDEHVAVVTINRPEARNAINADFAMGMESAIDRIEADDHIWVGIISGVPPVFCAGADLKVVASGGRRTLYTERGGFAGIARRERTKPLIAAVEGAALAGGCELALACDLIVASRAASFGIPEVKRSLVAAAGGLTRLAQIVPRNIALELAMTGDPIDAERAHHFGLVNVLCEPGDVLGAALILAARISVNAPIATRASRQVVVESLRVSEEESWRLSQEQFARVEATQDFLEGPRAFNEKRPPQWTGH
jgi:enoyl-CoA hydratase